MSRLYQAALKVMFMIPPERAHDIINQGLRFLQWAWPVNRALGGILPVSDPEAKLAQEVFGVTIPRPLGLAAGFDKNGAAADVWMPVGFGYAELGTVTASPQPGNPPPRLFRLKADKAILNRMGFNNHGAADVAVNVRRRNYRDIIGINIGKTKVVPAENAVEDYVRSTHLLSGLADFVVVNVSSPNTPGLRDLQAVDSLRPILAAVLQASEKPVLVKIAPDLANEDVDAIADLAVEIGLAGIVATNTTISREGLKSDTSDLGAGGISGPPVRARAQEVMERLYARVGDDLVLVGSGGISSAQDAWERITAGATLLQGYTGMIYGGPEWIRDIHRGLLKQLDAHGLSNISQAVGSGLKWVDEA